MCSLSHIYTLLNNILPVFEHYMDGITMNLFIHLNFIWMEPYILLFCVLLLFHNIIFVKVIRILGIPVFCLYLLFYCIPLHEYTAGYLSIFYCYVLLLVDISVVLKFRLFLGEYFSTYLMVHIKNFYEVYAYRWTCWIIRYELHSIRKYQIVFKSSYNNLHSTSRMKDPITPHSLQHLVLSDF